MKFYSENKKNQNAYRNLGFEKVNAPNPKKSEPKSNTTKCETDGRVRGKK